MQLIMGTSAADWGILRAKVKCLQKALIPPAVLAGVLALLLGPKSPWEVCRILPLSSSLWNLRQRSDRADFRRYAHWGQA